MAKDARLIISCRIATVAVLLILLGLVLQGPLDKWINHVALGQLEHTNETYLNESFEDASRLFLILTGVKSVLAVVEGSEVGVGFGLELGDVVQGVYDYVDFAWQIILWATMIIVMTRMTLELSQFVDQWLLAMALASLILYLSAAWFIPWKKALTRVLRDVAFFSTILAIAAYFVVPLAVAGGASLSEQITASRLTNAESNIATMKIELDQRFEAVENAEGILVKAARVSEAMKALTSFLATRTIELFWDVITVSAAYLFDTIIFPLGLFLIMFWLTRILGRYLFGLRRSQVFKEDMDVIMARYWRREEAKQDEPTG